MSSFYCVGINCNSSSHYQSTIHKCRYPSYLMRVAPPRVYSSVDLRNMLVPKTYEVRKVNTTVSHNHSHRNFDDVSTKSSLESKDSAESTKKNYNKIMNNDDIQFYQKDANEVICKINELSLNQKDLDMDGYEIFNTKLTILDKKECIGGQRSEKSFKISKVEVIDETQNNNNCHTINPTDSEHISDDNCLALTSENLKSKKDIQSEDEQFENDVFYDFDNEEQNIDYVNNSLKLSFITESIITENDDKDKFFEICQKCHKRCGPQKMVRNPIK